MKSIRKSFANESFSGELGLWRPWRPWRPGHPKILSGSGLEVQVLARVHAEALRCQVSRMIIQKVSMVSMVSIQSKIECKSIQNPPVWYNFPNFWSPQLSTTIHKVSMQVENCSFLTQRVSHAGQLSCRFVDWGRFVPEHRRCQGCVIGTQRYYYTA